MSTVTIDWYGWLGILFIIVVAAGTAYAVFWFERENEKEDDDARDE